MKTARFERTWLASVTPTPRSAAAAEPLAVRVARAAWALEDSMERFVQAGDQNRGHLEVQAARDV